MWDLVPLVLSIAIFCLIALAFYFCRVLEKVQEQMREELEIKKGGDYAI